MSILTDLSQHFDQWKEKHFGPSIATYRPLLSNGFQNAVDNVPPAVLDALMQKPKQLKEGERETIAYLQKCHAIKEQLAAGDASQATSLLDNPILGIRAFEAVTQDTNNPAVLAAKVAGASILVRKARDLDGDGYVSCYQAARKHVQDAMIGYSRLDDKKQALNAARFWESQFIARSGHEAPAFLEQATPMIQEGQPGTGVLLETLTDIGLFSEPEHLDLVLAKHPNDDYKISRLKDIEKGHAKPLPGQEHVILEQARTHGQTPTVVQKAALSLLVPSIRYSKETQDFLVAEIQDGSLDTLKAACTEWSSVAHFAIQYADQHEDGLEGRLSIKKVLDTILPDELTGKGVAEIRNYMAGLALADVKMQYLKPADKIHAPRRLDPLAARVAANLLSQVLHDETAGVAATEHAGILLQGLIEAEDYKRAKNENLLGDRLDKHRLGEAFQKSAELATYNQLAWPYDRKTPELQAEYERVKKVVLDYQAQNPLIHDSSEVYYLQSKEEQLDQIGYGRAVVNGLLHAGDERTIKIGQKILQKMDGEKPAAPARRFAMAEPAV